MKKESFKDKFFDRLGILFFTTVWILVIAYCILTWKW